MGSGLSHFLTHGLTDVKSIVHYWPDSVIAEPVVASFDTNIMARNS